MLGTLERNMEEMLAILIAGIRNSFFRYSLDDDASQTLDQITGGLRATSLRVSKTVLSAWMLLLQ
jgi:hypothetical protein